MSSVSCNSWLLLLCMSFKNSTSLWYKDTYIAPILYWHIQEMNDSSLLRNCIPVACLLSLFLHSHPHKRMITTLWPKLIELFIMAKQFLLFKMYSIKSTYLAWGGTVMYICVCLSVTWLTLCSRVHRAKRSTWTLKIDELKPDPWPPSHQHCVTVWKAVWNWKTQRTAA